jgi:hypothetical protein
MIDFARYLKNKETTKEKTMTVTVDYNALLNNEFASEIKQGLPYCQILNAPNMSQAQLDKINPPHGIFISLENAGIAGLNTDNLPSHEQSFRDGEEIVEGFLTNHLRFVVLHVSPLVVQSQGQLVGLYFATGGGVSDAGKLVSSQPELYHNRSWWLIAPLTEDNQLMSSTPIKLSLRGAVGATFAQERKQALIEMEVEFFKKAGQPRQSLSSKAHSCFVMDWTLAPYKASGKAPYEYVSARKGIATEQKTVHRYGAGKDSRNVTITPDTLENLLIIPSSPTGKTLAAWYEEYQETFFKRVKALSSPTPEPEAVAIETDIEVEVAEFNAEDLCPF